MRIRALSIGGIACFLILAALASGCAQTPADDATAPATPETAAPSDSPEPTDDGATVRGTKGTPSVLGDWTITVRQVEFGSGNDDVQVESGKTRMEVEVDLRNSSGAALSVESQDWVVVDATGASYSVLPSSRPEKQGQRAIPAGQSEDVSINFAVPSANGAFTLRFSPSQGASGALDVPISAGATGDDTPRDDGNATDDKPADPPPSGYGY